jgi:hypothetical protein
MTAPPCIGKTREIGVMQFFSIVLMLHQHLYADGSEANAPDAAKRQSTDAGRAAGCIGPFLAQRASGFSWLTAPPDGRLVRTPPAAERLTACCEARLLAAHVVVCGIIA